MKAIVIAAAFLAALVHADPKSEDDPATEATKVEAVAQARSQIEAAQAQMEAARVQMESARAEMAAAAKQMAEAASDGLRTAYKERPFLGVFIGDQSEDGIVVAGVTPDGGAEAAGIEAEDVIVAVGGESLTGHERPLTVLRRILDGTASSSGGIEVVVSRAGETHSFDVVPTETTVMAFGSIPYTDHGEPLQIDVLPHTALRHIDRLWDGSHPARAVSVRPVRPQGFHFVDIGEDLGGYFGVDGGVLVLNVPAKSELKPGDIVRRIDGADVASSDEAYRLLTASSGSHAEVEVRRGRSGIGVVRKNWTVKVPSTKLPKSMQQTIRTLPSGEPGKETVIVTGSVLRTDPEVQLDVEVEKDAD